MGQHRREGTELRRRFMEDLVLAGKADRTVGAYVDEVRRLAEHYWTPPDRLTEEQVRGYLLHLVNEKKVARGTHTIALCAIKLFYEVTVQREWGIFDLARPRSERKLPVVLSRDETWRILDCVSIPGYRVCLTTIYALGLRLMEGITLTPAQVDSDRMVVHIHGKGAKDRYVPIQAQTVELLRGYWKTHRSARWLFPASTRHGIEHSLATNAGPVDRSSVQSAFQRARVKAGVRKKAHVHTLRHSYATHLLEDGTALPLIQEYLGHNRITSTRIYLHLTREVRKTAEDPIARLMLRPSPPDGE